MLSRRAHPISPHATRRKLRHPSSSFPQSPPGSRPLVSGMLTLAVCLVPLAALWILSTGGVGNGAYFGGALFLLNSPPNLRAMPRTALGNGGRVPTKDQSTYMLPPPPANDAPAKVSSIRFNRLPPPPLPPPPQFPKLKIRPEDANCPFRDSSIYRRVYVYPNRGDVNNGWGGSILSDYGRNLTNIPEWPWLGFDQLARNHSKGHYNIYSQNIQYTTELLVREIMINPQSCLRTYNPEEATLFYVPYLPSIEHHQGDDHKTDYTFSPFGRAIVNILDKGEYDSWEQLFGLTSEYWKRRGGSDHILVFSEPMHGLWHPRNRRGNYHFIFTQYQLKPPIVISVELSTTFVEMYPACTAKNILVPYPNTDGRWFNGELERMSEENRKQAEIDIHNSPVVLASEIELESRGSLVKARPIAQYYSAGNHGTCTTLRRAMQNDYFSCSKAYGILKHQLNAKYYAIGMRLSTFCPCPGGDSPSAKRMFDALLAGCIPVILSHDFVWPFTKEFDAADYHDVDPADFSIRLNADEYDEPLLDPETCQPYNANKPGLQAFLERFSADDIAHLRTGMMRARFMYSWYEHYDDNESTPRYPKSENPLRDGILPTGGAAYSVVNALAKRAAGARWPDCAEEMQQPHGPNPMKFKC